MKHLILTAVMASGLTLFASSGVKAQSDSSKTDKSEIKYGLGISIGSKKSDSTNAQPNKGRFVGGITFTRFDLGFSRLIDNGSFSLSTPNQFLDYRGGKTSHVSFDLVQFGYRFGDNFKLHLSAGFDWTHIRLNNDITMQKNTPNLVYTTDPIRYSKNRFSSSYVHVPLNFEFRTDENGKGKRFYFIVSPEVGFLMNGKVKQISDEKGKTKEKDDYTFAPFRYGGAVRFGYSDLGFFVKYYANDMFDSAPQAGLKNMAFGITLGIH